MRYPKLSQAGKDVQKAPLNGWIAFSEDDERPIAYGATYDEVVANAGKQGVSDLVVVKVPETWIYRVSVADEAARAR
jgi:hypothetical protein